MVLQDLKFKWYHLHLVNALSSHQMSAWKGAESRQSLGLERNEMRSSRRKPNSSPSPMDTAGKGD